MSGLLHGRVAIVTGAGRGIGRAIAESLVTAGAQVIVADNGTSIAGDGGDPEVARTAAKELNDKAGAGSALAFTESVASPGVGKQLVDLAVRTYGGIDIVVNNAAILRDAPVFRADPADWDAVIRTNLSSAFYLINAASGVMREQGKSGRGGTDNKGDGYDWGRIVNIVSSAGLYGNLGQAAYASAKAGLFGLTRVTAMDLASAQITANAVAPFARTRVTEIFQPANEAEEAYKERTLKIGAHHVANLVTALCLPKARTITGQLLGVRGRQIFVFGQPRPVVGMEVFADPEHIADELIAGVEGWFTDLTTDLETFNTDPLV
jgi:NAD(P)-dependent dehydrogenase (short-subunit alcohol dehydrogenase family)